MTLKKSIVSLCVLCCAFALTIQGASAASILLLHETGGNGDRFVGDYWGQYGGEAYISATEDFLIESFGGVATIDSYNLTDDPMGLNDTNILTSTTEKLAILNSYDLIIVDTSVGSGSLRDQPYIYNSLVTTPLIAWKTFLTRSDRWGWHAQGSPSDNDGSTVTETLALEGGGSVRLYDRGPYEAHPTVWFPGNTNIPTTVTQLSVRFYQNAVTSGSIVARWPGNPTGYAIARWDNVGQPFYDGSPTTPGGPRMQFVFPDDRNEIPYETTGLAEGQHKAFNPNEVLSEEGRTYLKNLIVDFAPALAPENKILVVGATGDSGVNGGRHFGYEWGRNMDEIYEADTIHLMEEFFAPTASVDYYDISDSDYMNLQGLGTATTDTLAWLGNYDFIWMGHSVPTGTIGSGNADRSTAWNSLTIPVIAAGQYIAGNNNSRWSWISSGSPSENDGTTPTTVLDVNDTGHYAFANVDVSGGTLRLYPEAPYTPASNWYNGTTNTGLQSLGQRSAVNDLTGNTGNRIAEFQGVTNWCNIIVWDGAAIGQPFYTGSPQTCNGPRALLNIMDNRNQIDPTLVGGAAKGYNTLSLLTDEGKQMIKDLMVGMSSVPLPVELGSFELE